jgi:hypothetical protein
VVDRDGGGAGPVGQFGDHELDVRNKAGWGKRQGVR